MERGPPKSRLSVCGQVRASPQCQGRSTVTVVDPEKSVTRGSSEYPYRQGKPRNLSRSASSIIRAILAEFYEGVPSPTNPLRYARVIEEQPLDRLRLSRGNPGRRTRTQNFTAAGAGQEQHPLREPSCAATMQSRRLLRIR
jgi:hypothetical protein